MKKLVNGLLIVSMLAVGTSFIALQAYDNDGYGSFFGGLTGGMIGSAITSKKSNGPSRAEIEAQRAQDKAEQIQREQTTRELQMMRERMQLEKAQVSRDEQLRQIMLQQARGSQSPLNMVMILFILLCVMGVAGMGFMLFGRKKTTDRNVNE